MPYPSDNSPIASQTVCTAQSNGWIWDIGLPTRRGIGLRLLERAHHRRRSGNELRRLSARTGGPKDIGSPRKLTFKPGYRETFWHRNCVAIGLSAGFIEPLEASALALVELVRRHAQRRNAGDAPAMDIVRDGSTRRLRTDGAA